MGPSWQGLALLAGMAAVTGAAGWTLHGPGGERGRYLAPVWWAGTGTGTGIALWLGERVPGLEPWGPLVLLAWLALALGLEVAAGGGAPWPGRGESLGVFDAELVLALSATMTATVVGAPTVGWWFLPLVTVSLVALSSALVGRIRAVAVADETVVAAMRLPEVLGYSRPDHAQAVEGVCACLAEEIGIDAEQRETLLSAARLHDVGLVSLVRPIRGGSTSQLAPRDQQRVALRSAEIAAELHFPPPVVEVLEHQAHAYIDHVSYRADVPRPARILKVANALDDYTAGERTPEAFARAMERINRQAGYEFDPVVVSAARKVVERVTASRGGPPAAGPPSVPGPRPGGPP
ncbi:HD-GYP domain-containing protein [Kytococcus aerolatus]|nr:HD domain-containing phosphohydrolase [Kytococcus aerolatus]